MKKAFKRAMSAVSAAAISLSLVPIAEFSYISEAADQYSVRDPFYNFSSSYNYYESEHFQFIWGNSGDSSKVTTAFLEGNAKNLENIWNVYMDELGMEPPSQSVNLSLRDGKEYKTNIYISGTGLSGMEDDWAYMSYDSGGYAYMFCCVDAMQYNPPSWVLPHEFGHVMTAHQLGWNTNKYSYAWWEALGNWFREQYLYSDYSTDTTGHGTDFFETYMKNLCFTFPFGRDYYAAWPFLQYLTENPENLDGYGKEFVKTMLQQGQVDEFPFDQVERLANADLKDTLGYYAAHMAGLDFEHGDAYRARLDELLAQGDWNWQQIYTMLEPVAGSNHVYTVPTERAPQFAGLNIIPLEVSSGNIEVKLAGLSDAEGADWRACVVQQASDGSCTYSELFSSNDSVSVAYTGGKAYLAVIATPDLDTVTKYGLPGIYDNNSEFSESKVPFSSKTRYPYVVAFSDNVSITQRTVSTTSSNWWEQATYSKHSNGGGLVASTAKVDASVYVAPNAIVKGSATVTGNAKILDHAVVEGSAKVSGNAVIAGYGMVAENATVSGNARVDDYAMVMGTANISGNAKIIESACVYGNTTMTDYAVAKGVAFIMSDSSLSGQGVGDGDLYTDYNISFTKGTSYGWTSAQTYASNRPYTDKLMYAYDFGTDSSVTAADRYNSTYALNLGAEWESSRTSASGVMTFDGSDFIPGMLLDRGILYTNDIDIQIALLDRDTTGDIENVLYLGNSDAHLSIDIQSNNIIAALTDGSTTQQVVAENAITDGVWAKVQFILDGDTGRIVVDGQTVAQGNMTLNPSDVANAVDISDDSAKYVLGGSFNGSVDFARFFYAAAETPSEVYTETEDLSQATETVIVGDVNFDGKINAFDLVKLRKNLTLTGATINAKQMAAMDVNGDSSVTVADLVTLQSYVLGSVKKFPAGDTKEVIIYN